MSQNEFETSKNFEEEEEQLVIKERPLIDGSLSEKSMRQDFVKKVYSIFST